MRFYIVDDDLNIVLILKSIIEKKGLGTVIGYESNSVSALEEILEDAPDIVLVDYLMPKLDGNSLMRIVNEKYPGVRFIMISQISDPKLVEDVYASGVEFFIHKPINIIEVESVIKSVMEKIDLIKRFELLKGLIAEPAVGGGGVRPSAARPGLGFGLSFGPGTGTGTGAGMGTGAGNSDIDQVRKILCDIAIHGEKGAEDIIAYCDTRLNRNKGSTPTLNDYCEQNNENPKIFKQRIRRAVAIGLRNLAHIGIEDNLNDCYTQYANKLFDYEDIRLEMEFLRGKRTSGGKVNIEKFIENLLLLSKNN